MDNLVEEITNIIQNKLECQTMEYDIQFICCSCKITEIERKHIMEIVAKQRFLEDIERKYSTIDAIITFPTQWEISESQMGWIVY